jgi:hypothetical protein
MPTAIIAGAELAELAGKMLSLETLTTPMLGRDRRQSASAASPSVTSASAGSSERNSRSPTAVGATDRMVRARSTTPIRCSRLRIA